MDVTCTNLQFFQPVRVDSLISTMSC
jgi:hypothetical protein